MSGMYMRVVCVYICKTVCWCVYLMCWIQYACVDYAWGMVRICVCVCATYGEHGLCMLHVHACILDACGLRLRHVGHAFVALCVCVRYTDEDMRTRVTHTDMYIICVICLRHVVCDVQVCSHERYTPCALNMYCRGMLGVYTMLCSYTSMLYCVVCVCMMCYYILGTCVVYTSYMRWMLVECDKRYLCG